MVVLLFACVSVCVFDCEFVVFVICLVHVNWLDCVSCWLSACGFDLFNVCVCLCDCLCA